MSTLVPLGLKGDRLLFVNEVQSGLACGCVCPSCAGRLVARNRDTVGRQRRPHFSHLQKTSCDGAFESAIHRAAKDILCKPGTLLLPSISLENGEPTKAVHLVSGEHEPWLADLAMRPDIVAEVDGPFGTFALLIEVRFRHAVDDAKQRAYDGAGLACVEIDLADVDIAAFSDRAIFEQRVRDGFQHGRWVSLNVAATRAMTGLSHVFRIREQRFDTREVPFVSKRTRSTGAWLVKVQPVELHTESGTTERSIELEQLERDGIWGDSAGRPLPYPPGWYASGAASTSFKTRLVPIQVAWTFPGEQSALL